jgi:hypothetical protein
MVPHIIHTLCLRVRATAVYKSIARCPSLFSFICLKYIYSWLIIACYCTCSYGWIDIFPSRRAACKRRRAATWQGRWGPCGPYSRPIYLRPVSAGLSRSFAAQTGERRRERERERGIHGARWPPAAGDPVSPLVLLLRSSIPCVGWWRVDHPGRGLGDGWAIRVDGNARYLLDGMLASQVSGACL